MVYRLYRMNTHKYPVIHIIFYNLYMLYIRLKHCVFPYKLTTVTTKTDLINKFIHKTYKGNSSWIFENSSVRASGECKLTLVFWFILDLWSFTLKLNKIFFALRIKISGQVSHHDRQMCLYAALSTAKRKIRSICSLAKSAKLSNEMFRHKISELVLANL